MRGGGPVFWAAGGTTLAVLLLFSSHLRSQSALQPQQPVKSYRLTTSIPRQAPGASTPAAPRMPLDQLRAAARIYTPDVFQDEELAPPQQFDDGFNPCWRGPRGALHCLPAFHILGVYQAGCLDLYARLEAHNDVAKLSGRSHVSHSFYSQVHPTWPEYLRGLQLASAEASAGRLVGEVSPVHFHFVWVHQEKFNGAYVEAMGGFWRQCNARSAPEKRRLSHRECMRARMPEARKAEADAAARAGVRLQPPTLMRAVYGSFEPALIVMLRLPWERMHAAYYNYVHYRGRYAKLHGSDASGELSWANESIGAFHRCEAEFGPISCALRFESLTRENEETFYHCDQLLKGIYAVFLPQWRREFARLLPLRTEEYFSAPEAVLARAFRFLRLRVPQTPQEWRPILGRGRVVHGSRPPDGKPPLPHDVRALLRHFYLPWQRILAEQLAAEEDAAQWREWAEATEDVVLLPRRPTEAEVL